MKLNFTFKHLDPSEALQAHTRESLESIGRFLLKDGFANVYYSKQNHEFCVEMSVNTRERYYKATAEHSDPYQAVNAAIEKLEKQFLKTRKTVQNHKKPELSKTGRLDQMNENFEPQRRFKKAA